LPRRFFQALPTDIQRLAVKNYHLWRQNPSHPSLRFRRLQGSDDRFTIRLGDHYRALGKMAGEEMTWVWIGAYADYDRVSRLSRVQERSQVCGAAVQVAVTTTRPGGRRRSLLRIMLSLRT